MVLRRRGEWRARECVSVWLCARARAWGGSFLIQQRARAKRKSGVGVGVGARSAPSKVSPPSLLDAKHNAHDDPLLNNKNNNNRGRSARPRALAFYCRDQLMPSTPPPLRNARPRSNVVLCLARARGQVVRRRISASVSARRGKPRFLLRGGRKRHSHPFFPQPPLSPAQSRNAGHRKHHTPLGEPVCRVTASSPPQRR